MFASTNVAALRRRCIELRSGDLAISDWTVEQLAASIAAEREQLERVSPRVLALVGWQIYEMSLRVLREGSKRRTGTDPYYVLVKELADAVRASPSLGRSPRALGAIRAQALMASKLGDERSYNEAWALHREALSRLEMARDELGDDRSDVLLRLQFDEVEQQLLLAKAGTACRVAEYVISRWSEGIPLGKWDSSVESRWVVRLFHQLAEGLKSAQESLELTRRIDAEHDLADKVDEDRLLVRSAYRQPSIMAARAALLMVALCPETEALGMPPQGRASWSELREALIGSFADAYATVETSVGSSPLTQEHLRAIVQLRLTFALVVPGRDLDVNAKLDRTLGLDPSQGTSVEALARLLQRQGEIYGRSNANVIGSATMPAFIRSVESSRASMGTVGGYRAWRREWMMLDRYAGEQGRAERVDASLGRP